MLRKIVLFVLICICFVLQTSVFPAIAFAGIVPNLLIILVSAFGFMRGKKEGMFIGFFSGLVIDIFCGSYLGVYALLYMCVGYLNGYFRKRFYPEDIKLPLLLIALSDLLLNLGVYVIMFFIRGRFHLFSYMKTVILPELIYTMVITIFLYFAFMKINQLLERYERRGGLRFDS